MSVTEDLPDIGNETRERETFRGVVRDFLSDTCGSEVIRVAMEDRSFPQPLNREMAKLGLFGIEVPEHLGGGGGSFNDLSVVLETLGEFCAVTPYLSSTVLCVGALLGSSSEELRWRWLPELAAGEALGAVAMHDVFTPAGGTQLVATPDGDSWRLNGCAGLVSDGATADVLAVVARAEHGVWQIAIVERGTRGLSTRARRTTDRTRRLDDLLLDEVRVPADQIVARGPKAADLVDTLTDRFAIAIALDSVGVASHLVTITTDYVKQREQFGRAIGSFQAVKHRVADMYVQTEAMRLLARDAANLLASHEGGCHLAVSQAKEYGTSAAADVAGAALQMHGGIGYTWEHDLHIFLKRAQLNTALAGNVRWHRSRAARFLIPESV